MKLAIDCRSLRKAPSGIPNFLVSAINGIALYKPDWQIYLLSNEEFNAELAIEIDFRHNIKVIIEPTFILNNISFIWLITKANALVEKINPDFYWAPAFLLPPFLPKQLKTLVTVHDLVFKEYKKTMSGVNKFFFGLLHDYSINKADMLWANSLYTKEGIEKYFKNRKCMNIYKGFFINTSVFYQVQVNESKRETLLSKLKIRDKFILFVGTLEPRKNLSFLLSLMPSLAIQGFDLLVVGAKGWGKTNIIRIIESEGYPRSNVVFAGHITTQELVLLYNLASIYVSTSINEGFGMPQLEAMACGCPVVSPHNSAMIEVVEGAGVTVKTWDENDWLEAISLVYSNRQKYVEAGFKRIKQYKKENVIKNLVDYITKEI